VIQVNDIPLVMPTDVTAGSFPIDLAGLLFAPQTLLPDGRGGTFPPAQPPHRLEYAPGTLYWPQGASRFAVGQYLVTDLEAQQIREIVLEDPITNYLTLTLGGEGTGQDAVTFQMHMLHLLPLQLDRSVDSPVGERGFYLLVLVDYRYFLQTLAPDWVIDDTTTWNDLDTALLTFLPAGSTADAVDADYLQPGADLAPPELATDGVVGWAGPLLDAICLASGRRFVANTDGTFTLQNVTNARSAHLAALTANLDHRRYGGKLAFPPEDEDTQGLVLIPNSLLFVFPEESGGTTEVAPYTKQVTFDSVRTAALMTTDVPIREGELVVPTTLWCDNANTADLDAWAERWATDWYAFLSAPTVQHYSGCIDFPPDGLSDVQVWCVYGDDAWTRVYRGLLNPRPHVVLGYSGVAPIPANSLIVEAVSGTPAYGGIRTIRFDTADGFSLSQPSTGIVRVDFTATATVAISNTALAPAYPITDTFTTLRADNSTGASFQATTPGTLADLVLLAATNSQWGVVTTVAQNFSGDKVFADDVTVGGDLYAINYIYIGEATGTPTDARAKLMTDSAQDQWVSCETPGYIGPGVGLGHYWTLWNVLDNITPFTEFIVGHRDASSTGARYALDIGGVLYPGVSGTDALGNIFTGGICTTVGAGTIPSGGVTSVNTLAGALSLLAGTGIVITDNGLDEITVSSSVAGTVTSVAMTVPGFLSVSGSPITTSGTLAVSLATQSANLVFAGPSSGGAATPTFRSLVTDDLANGIVTFAKMQAITDGTLLGASGGTAVEEITPTLGLTISSNKLKKNFVGCIVNNSGTTTLTNTAFTAIAWDATDIKDTDGFHDPATNNTRITIPTDYGGTYRITGSGYVNIVSSDPNNVVWEIYKNGTTQIAVGYGNHTDYATNVQPNAVVDLAAGDYIEFRVFHNYGSNRTFLVASPQAMSYLCVERIGD